MGGRRRRGPAPPPRSCLPARLACTRRGGEGEGERGGGCQTTAPSQHGDQMGGGRTVGLDSHTPIRVFVAAMANWVVLPPAGEPKLVHSLRGSSWEWSAAQGCCQFAASGTVAHLVKQRPKTRPGGPRWAAPHAQHTQFPQTRSGRLSAPIAPNPTQVAGGPAHCAIRWQPQSGAGGLPPATTCIAAQTPRNRE
jgi:hypothetical protein